MSVPAVWCRIPSQGNAGDRLTPWLVRRITGRPARWVHPDAPGPRFLVAGSIAALAGEGAVVWGAGILATDERLHPGARFVAVRGPLTREAARRSGADCPPVYGDPGLLVPRYHRRRRAATARACGLVPHFADLARAQPAVPETMTIIDIRQPVTTLVDQLLECALVVSSSLHGIILSHAYGIPAVWVSYGDLPNGDGAKFHDYFLSIGVPVPPPYPMGVRGRPPAPAALADFATLPAHLPDLDLLLDRCPFR